MKTWAELSSNVSTESRELAKWEYILFLDWLKTQPKRKRVAVTTAIRPLIVLPKLSSVRVELVEASKRQKLEEAVAPKLKRAKTKYQWRPLVKKFMQTRNTPATLDDIAAGLGIKQDVDRLKLSSALHHMGISGILRRVGEVSSQGKSRAFTLWQLP